MVGKSKGKGNVPLARPAPGAASAGQRAAVGLLLLAWGLLLYAVREQPLFWDTVQLAGKHATHYSGGGARWLLPPALDSGHPPTFGLYLAACWRLAGRSLLTSHVAMWSWLLLGGWGAYRAVAHWVPGRWVLPTVLLLSVDPVWLGQAVLVSPDIWVMTAWWWMLVGLQERRAGVLAAATCLAALTSTRGMMLVAAMYGIGVGWQVLDGRCTPRAAVRLLAIFVPAGLLGAGFLAYHYVGTGWIGYHAGSPWAPSFERVGAAGLAKNIAVLGWRVLDFGRAVPVLLVLGLGYAARHNRAARQLPPRVPHWLVVLIGLSVFLLPSFLLYRGLSGHRYLLPILQWLLVGTILFITPLKNSFHKKLLYGTILLSLVLGHRWIYPDRISQQWDATLAHQPYQQLRRTAFDYLDAQRIPYDSVGTVFPEIGARDLRELNGRATGLVDWHSHRTPYIWYSNVMNDFSDAELDTLASLPVVARWNRGGVRLVLYRRSTH